MGRSGARRELAALQDLDEEVAEYLVSSLVDAAEDNGGPLDSDGVLEVIEPFVEGVVLEEAQIGALAHRVAALMAEPDEPDEPEAGSPQQEALSAKEQRRAKLNAPAPEPEPEREPELEAAPESEPPHEPGSETDEGAQQLAFLRESFPSLSSQDIRQIIKQNRGQVDDRAIELLFQRQAAKDAKAEAAQRRGPASTGADAGSAGKLSEAEKRDEAKRRRALLERYENSGAVGTGGGRRKNATGGVKTVHGRLPTKAEAARQRAAEQRAKVRYREGEIVTRTGEKYTPVPLSKEEEEREKALKAATSVNLAYKTSKGRRHKGR
jgi:hypothetical protein